MHNPVGKGVESRDARGGELAVLLPVVAVILFLAIYPQFIVQRTQKSVDQSVVATAAAEIRVIE